MGEYIKHRGETVKIGTCEDLYYTTAQQFKAAYQAGKLERTEHGENPEIYFKENTFRFRFPFPDEYALQIGQHDNFCRGVLLQLPTGLAEIGHTHCFTEYPTPAGNFGVQFDCPQSETGKKSPYIFTRNIDPKEIFSVLVTQQKIIENRLHTICRCPFCGSSSRMTEDEIFLMLEHVKTHPDRFQEMQIQVLQIALDGYLTEFL